ncbi:regulatory protein, luxR family [Streptomyces sp. DvalAA-14]|uniref:helix-turn-helix transcriptional regulator n=1 Tax=unclassified Streptomyces TaxID=2593676 RepID=UPI00081B12B6|nr:MULTISPECIES: helix-turn-helix transcriptional regulator [unclassified Streptomyces]MYS20092.1 HTH domain-containing protein [Streptomyces sp. SID4948]SCD60724.1 regulatory protein, luxR family [Streptomyces sp. DvalAA-14]
MQDDDEIPALALYQVLRARGTAASEAELGKAAGLDRDQAERGRRRLQRLGLIRFEDDVLEPVDPDTALTRTMSAYRASVAEQLRTSTDLQELTDSLLTVYRPAVAREASLVEVEYLTERRKKDRLLRELDSTVRHTSDSIHPGPVAAPVAVLDASARQDEAMIRRGVRNRTIYSQSAVQVPAFNRHLRDLSAVGVEVRLIDHAPYDLIIYDGQVAVFRGGPLVPGGAPTAIVVRGSALIEGQTAVFEDLWLRAVPYVRDAPTGAETELTSQEQVVIRLLAGGLSDDQIARRLGVSRRTVQRAVTKLMERLGASSRFEAGLKLAQDPEFARSRGKMV